MKSWGEREAIVLSTGSVTYAELARLKEEKLRTLETVTSGEVVPLEGDFSATSIATLLALIDKKAIVVPLSERQPEETKEIYRRMASVASPLYEKLRSRGHAGLVLFTSGSTGKPKAAVHDLQTLLEKFQTPRPAYRMISFLLWDHIGGVNTLFHSLYNGGTLIVPEDRDPNTICKLIEETRVELLPTSPTFLRFLLLTKAWERFDISSLKTISYGSEPMPESTLLGLRDALPQVHLVQTYGLTELGILRAKSKSSDSLWVKVGGEGYQTRIVDGLLEIKARSSMLGYLNAESPFTPDGWFKTNDVVEQDGEWLKILGRASEIINVGGEKVFPAEVESVILKMPNVVQVNVRAQNNPLLGQVVKAEVQLQKSEDLLAFQSRLRAFCAPHLAKYKIPQIVKIK